MAKQTINNGESGLITRTKLNDNYTELYDKDASQDVTIGQNTDNTTNLAVRVTDNEADIVLLDDRVTVNEADIVVLQTPPDSARLNPVAVAPTHVEGQFYYDSVSGTFQVQGPYTGIEVAPGHGEHMHVINNTGVEIPAGSAVRVEGVSGGIPQIVLAQADTFPNANVLGITIIAIPDATASAVAISGIIDVDTSLLAAGGPYYLSSTVPGGLTLTAPAIRTEVGGVLVSDATVGKFRADINVNQAIPIVYGGLEGQTVGNNVYSLTTTPQDIKNYELTHEVVVEVDALNGLITLPNDGEYRMTITASFSFLTSAATRIVTIELYDATGTEVHYPYRKSIAKGATVDSFSFSWGINELANNVHKVRLYSDTVMDITFDYIEFDITSISIT